jgi:hypothetical protein
MWQVVGYAVLTVVAGMILAAWFRPYMALVLVYVLYPVKQLMGTYLPIFLQISPLFNFVVALGVGMGVVSQFARRRRPLTGMGNGVTVIFLTLYVYATFALLWTPGKGVERWLDGYAYWVMQVMLLPLTIKSLEDYRRTLLPLLVLSIVITFLFMSRATWYGARFSIYISGKGSEFESRGNALTIGQLGGMAAIAGALMLPRRGGLIVGGLRIGAILAGLGLGLLVGSRAQAALAVLTGAMFYPMSRRIKNVTQFIVTIGGLAVFLLMVYVGVKVFLGHGAEQSKRWDISSWWDIIASRAEDAMPLIRAYAASPQYWLQGMGTNAATAFIDPTLPYIHNAPFEMLCELGVFGFALYLIGCVMAFNAGRRLFKLFAQDPVGRATVGVLLAMCFYLWALSLKQYTFVSVPEPYFFWIIMTKIYKYERREAVLAAEREDYVLEDGSVEGYDGQTAAA